MESQWQARPLMTLPPERYSHRFPPSLQRAQSCEKLAFVIF